MNTPPGFLWYQKEENQFYLNQTQSPDGWAPLPVAINPKDISKKDLEDLAQAISAGSQYAIYVDQNSPYASDSKENRGQSSLRPFRTLERALLEAARRSFRPGSGGTEGNDITDRISIYLSPGVYDVENGLGGELLSENFNRRQDASKLLIANKDYLVEKAYQTSQQNPVYVLSLTPIEEVEYKRDLSYFIEAVAEDISAGSNDHVLSISSNLLTSSGQFIQSYATETKRQSAREALRILRDTSREVIKNQANTQEGGVRLPHITVDQSDVTNPCQSTQLTSDTLYSIILETLSSNIDPRTIEVNPGTDTANFPTEGEPRPETLRAFNSFHRGGIILPRGVSIIGADLRKVVIRPKYVPEAHNSSVSRSAIFRMTGGNFFSGFTVMDKPGLSESHHKLTCFEFCGFSDLSAYYNKVALAFQDSSKFNRLQDAASLLRANITWIQKKVFRSVIPGSETQNKYLNIFEAETPSMLSAIISSCTSTGNKQILDYAKRFKKFHIDTLSTAALKETAIAYYSSLFERLDFYAREAICNRANEVEGGYQDDRIAPDTTSLNNPCQDVQSIVHTLIEIITATMSGSEIPEANYNEWSIEDASPVISEYRIVGDFPQNPVEGASPYIYSASLRSRWGMCGIDADGSVVSGFKSFVAAQFTVISMQSDPLCFTTEDIIGEVEKRYVGTRPQDTVDYRHFGYRVTNGAYSQLVSCFCIAPAVHYWNSSGGEFSITNSTSNFGDISLYAEGFLDDRHGGGAYFQDRGHKVIGVKKPKDVDLTVRTFVIGYIKRLGTALTDSNAQTGTITLTGSINTYQYTIDNPAYPTRIYANLPGNISISADVISYTTDTNGETTLQVKFNQSYLENWVANEDDDNYKRGLIGASLYFERYVDTRSYDDHFYKLIIDKAQSTEGKKREPVVNYILRLDNVIQATDQPFNGHWDEAKGRGNLYYLNDIKKGTGLITYPEREYFEAIMLSAYVNPRRQMEYYEDAVVTTVLDNELNKDPRYPIVTERTEGATLQAVKHILELLNIDWAIIESSQDRLVEFEEDNIRTIAFNKPSIIRCGGQTWEYVGYYNYDTAIPAVQPKKLGEGLGPVALEQMRLSKTQTQVQGGRIYATGMDEEGSTYAGNRITDLKTGQQRTVNLGTSPQIGDNFIVTDFESLSAETFTTNTATVTGDLDVLGITTAYDIVTQNSIVAPLATFDELQTTGDSLYINVDASNSNNDWPLTISQSPEQTEAINLILPPQGGLLKQVLTNQGNGVLSWDNPQDLIISETTPNTGLGTLPLQAGQFWFDPQTTNLYVYYIDQDSAQWVQVNTNLAHGDVWTSNSNLNNTWLTDTVLELNDIGVLVQAYNADTVIDANYVATEENYTTLEKQKLYGVESGAEVNVNADWEAESGDALILNKPTLGTASAEDISFFASASQGALADSALQPSDVADGDLFNHVSVKTEDYNANVLEAIPCDTSSGSFTITFPVASTGSIKIYDVVGNSTDYGFGANSLIVAAPLGYSIMGQPSYSINTGGSQVVFQLVGTDWRLANLAIPDQPTKASRVIWVDTNGDNNNSGTLSHLPKQTIKDALANSEPGDCIKIRAGIYVEEAPLIVPRQVALMADSLRVTEIRPTEATKYNNLFLVDSGVKFWGLTFAGHQAGSFAVAFNPNANNTDIGASTLGAYILKSPYIQNCTSYTAQDDAGLAGSVSDGATGGGLEVDGAKCAANSPIRSIVVDSYTQVNLNGPGCLVRNDGYAQLVSFFATFCSYHIKAESGGQVNLSGGGTTDFGTYGLVATGYSPKPLFTAKARTEAYGTTYAQHWITIVDNKTFETKNNIEHKLQLNDKVQFVSRETALPSELSANTDYYVISDGLTTTQFQVSTTVQGSALVMTGDLNGEFEFIRKGDNEIEVVELSSSRLSTSNSISRPNAGQLLFPRTLFPLGATNQVSYTRIDNFHLEYNEDPSLHPFSYEYAEGGRLTIQNIVYEVDSATYNPTDGKVTITTLSNLPSGDGIALIEELSFILPTESYVVTGSVPINLNGEEVNEQSNDLAGYRVHFYSTTNRTLREVVSAGQVLDFRNRSQISAPSHTFEFVGSGTNYNALPFNGGVPNPANRIVEENNGRVYSSNTDELGNFAVGSQFSVDGTTGAVTINTDQFNLSGLNYIGPFSRNGGISTVGEQLQEVSNNTSLIASTGTADSNTVPTQFAVKSYIDSKMINTGSGLEGGGDLTTTRVIALNEESLDSLSKADSSLQPGDSVSELSWSSINW
jgi:hypothetical protein